MRLIDADALMKKIREVDFVADVDLMKITHDSMLTGFFHGSVQGIVDRLPTAYDLDKVVEELEEELERPIADCDLKINGKRANDREVVACKTGLKYAIEIVKGNCCKNRNSSECVVEVNKTSEGGAE